MAGNIAAIADPQDSATHVEVRNRLAIDLDIVVIFQRWSAVLLCSRYKKGELVWQVLPVVSQSARTSFPGDLFINKSCSCSSIFHWNSTKTVIK